MGPDQFLTLENDERIADCLIQLVKCGLPIKNPELLNTVQKIILEENISTSFKEENQDKDVIHRSFKYTLNFWLNCWNKSRTKLTEQYIKSWFHKLEEFLVSIGASDILTSPSRIFNADEAVLVYVQKLAEFLDQKD